MYLRAVAIRERLRPICAKIFIMFLRLRKHGDGGGRACGKVLLCTSRATVGRVPFMHAAVDKVWPAWVLELHRDGK